MLGFESVYGLRVMDAIVVARLGDGSLTLARDEGPTAATGAAGFGLLGFLIGLVLTQPLAGAAVGAAVGGSVAGAARRFGIGDDFLDDVKAAMTPGTSALFLLTRTDNPEAVLRHLRGLGGTVLKTNVNADLARQVQETLAAPRSAP